MSKGQKINRINTLDMRRMTTPEMIRNSVNVVYHRVVPFQIAIGQNFKEILCSM